MHTNVPCIHTAANPHRCGSARIRHRASPLTHPHPRTSSCRITGGKTLPTVTERHREASSSAARVETVRYGYYFARKRREPCAHGRTRTPPRPPCTRGMREAGGTPRVSLRIASPSICHSQSTTCGRRLSLLSTLITPNYLGTYARGHSGRGYVCPHQRILAGDGSSLTKHKVRDLRLSQEWSCARGVRRSAQLVPTLRAVVVFFLFPPGLVRAKVRM